MFTLNDNYTFSRPISVTVLSMLFREFSEAILTFEQLEVLQGTNKTLKSWNTQRWRGSERRNERKAQWQKRFPRPWKRHVVNYIENR
jgi:hypothetical protein